VLEPEVAGWEVFEGMLEAIVGVESEWTSSEGWLWGLDRSGGWESDGGWGRSLDRGGKQWAWLGDLNTWSLLDLDGGREDLSTWLHSLSLELEGMNSLGWVQEGSRDALSLELGLGLNLGLTDEHLLRLLDEDSSWLLLNKLRLLGLGLSDLKLLSLLLLLLLALKKLIGLGPEVQLQWNGFLTTDLNWIDGWGRGEGHVDVTDFLFDWNDVPVEFLLLGDNARGKGAKYD